MTRLRREKPGSSTSPSVWIYGPTLDLVVGCGAWSAPLLLLSYFAIATSARTWSIAFYGLALLFNYPHYMATIYRAYRRAEDFQKYRIFTVYTTGLILLTVLLSHFWLGILPFIFTLYLTWSPWHYSGQNYGLFMMFARRAGADLRQPERHALYGAFIVSYLILFLGFHTGPSSDPLFISLGIPLIAGHCAQIVLGAAFLALSGYGLRGLLRAVEWRKLIPCFTLFSSQFLWFLLPTAMAVIKGWEIPQSRYSSGVLAVMHSAQYLWITSYYARREAGEERGRNWRPWAYFAVLIAGGIALFVPGPWLASRVFHHDFTASFLIFTALVNLHHFILDGAIWKLRDGRIAALLLNSKVRLANAASGAGGRLAELLEWLSGSAPSARFVRVTAAALLLVWGTIDQARYYLALRSENARDLERAAVLDSFDSPLQTRLGRREMQDGHPQQAEAAWRKAMQSNPADPVPRQELLRYLLEQKRFDEAYGLTESSLQYSPRDANLLVDRGLLALRAGHTDQAVESWKHAIAVDPSQLLAHLYLANALDQQGQAQAAAAQYKISLNLIAKQPLAKRPEAEKTIAITLRMADCQTRASENEEAVQSYELATRIAAETGQSKLESVATVNEAALKADAGRVGDALRLYQRTLQLDDAIGDQTSSAEDWFAYGRFLDRAQFPAKLVYACLAKAESLEDFIPDSSQRKLLSDAATLAEKRAGTEASATRRNPDPSLQEALALRR